LDVLHAGQQPGKFGGPKRPLGRGQRAGPRCPGGAGIDLADLHLSTVSQWPAGPGHAGWPVTHWRQGRRWLRPGAPRPARIRRGGVMSPAIDGTAVSQVLERAVASGAVPHVAAIAADRDGVIYQGAVGP